MASFKGFINNRWIRGVGVALIAAAIISLVKDLRDPVFNVIKTFFALNIAMKL